MAAAENRPLAGKRIVVTRAPEQAREFSAELAALGAEVIPLPLLDFLPTENTAALDDAIRNLARFDWLIFTSQNAVTFFAGRSRELGLARESISGRPQIAAVGPGTARAAGLVGYPVHHVPAEARGLALAAELRQEMRGKRVLLPRSDRARPELPAALREAGAEVTEVVAYRTSTSEEAHGETLEKVLRAEVDVITLASPSAFKRLRELAGIELLHRLAARVAFAAIGPTTADAIRRAGLPVAIEAERPTSSGFAAAIVKYYSSSYPERATLP